MSEEKKKEILLTDIKGIGEVTAEKLREKDITVEKLAIMRPEELASELQITKKAAKDIVNDAKFKALASIVPVRTFAEQERHIKEVVQRIPTGSVELDKILGGGWRTESLHLLKGEYSSGKSQLAMQAAINCLKYLKRKVIWIETETGTFAPDRLKEMAKAEGLEIDGDTDFLLVPSTGTSTPYSQFLAYERAIQMMEERKLDVGVFIVDSFNATFREFYSGREMFPDRAREEARHLGFLDNIAAKYNMAIILTAQVMDIPDSGGQLGERVKTGHTQRAYGGNVLFHWCTYILSLDQLSGTDWEAVLADAPDRPKAKCRFRIVSAGVRDIVK
jgi:RecA/RadA recombinase